MPTSQNFRKLQTNFAAFPCPWYSDCFSAVATSSLSLLSSHWTMPLPMSIDILEILKSKRLFLAQYLSKNEYFFLDMMQLLRALFSAHIGGGANKFARSSVCRKRTISHNIANLVKHKLATCPTEASRLKHGESTIGLILLSRRNSTLIRNN